MDIKEHLLERGFDFSKNRALLDYQNNVATFLLYNLSGQIVGYQQYNPAGDKNMHFSTKDEDRKYVCKYYTYAGQEGDSNCRRGRKRMAVWGLETLMPWHKFVFVTEGIFDAVKIQNAGYPALATVSNDPYPLKPLFRALSKTVIAIMDNDVAGSKLAKFGNFAYTVPEPYKDMGEMPQDEAAAFLVSLDVFR